jgi:hypothetical protein
MPYVIGIGLSVGVAMFARCVGFDRDRAFYPIVMTVIASYYVFFAASIKDAMARQRGNNDPCARLEADHSRNRERRQAD